MFISITDFVQDQTKQQLLQHGIQLEEFGGDVQAVEVSALKVRGR